LVSMLSVFFTLCQSAYEDAKGNKDTEGAEAQKSAEKFLCFL